ncbi:unnamed protein product, partial [Rhizoctonia solani]
ALNEPLQVLVNLVDPQLFFLFLMTPIHHPAEIYQRLWLPSESIDNVPFSGLYCSLPGADTSYSFDQLGILPRTPITTMCLIHPLVAPDSRILAENRSGKRDFSTGESNDVASLCPGHNKQAVDVWEQHLFHYVYQYGLTYLVMADDAAGPCMIFAFTADFKRRFAT